MWIAVEFRNGKNRRLPANEHDGVVSAEVLGYGGARWITGYQLETDDGAVLARAQRSAERQIGLQSGDSYVLGFSESGQPIAP